MPGDFRLTPCAVVEVHGHLSQAAARTIEDIDTLHEERVSVIPDTAGEQGLEGAG
jgi:hypothetical protein